VLLVSSPQNGAAIMRAMKLLFGILTLTALLAIQVKAQSFLTNGLLAYYPFNGNVNDASGNGNTGTNYGATFTTDRFGFTNGAIYFNNGAYVLTGFFPPLGSASRTFSGWFNESSSAEMTLMFYGGTSIYPGDRFEPKINGQFAVDCSYGSLVTATNYADSNWHSFVVVVPPDAAVSNMLFYMDGVPQTNTSSDGPGNLVNTATNYPLQFGELWVGNRLLTGTLDDVRIYNRALSSNEVAQLYAFELIPPIAITNQPNGYALYGQNDTLSVSVSSQTPVSYQWYFVPANHSGQAGAYAETISDFVYGAVVTNGGFGYGNVPNVSFVGGGGASAMGFATVSNGVVTGIMVTNAGTGYTGVPDVVIDAPNGYLFGQTNRTLAITNASQNDLGNYYVVVANASGSVTSSVVDLTLLYPPSITNQPQDQVVDAYSNASFSVGASGTTPLSYQWLFQGTNPLVADAGTLVIPNVTPQNLGPYVVIVTNDYGSVTSSVANLYMHPYLATPFSGAITDWGQTNVLAVGAWGSGNLSYQWYFNGAAIPGATASNLVLSDIQFTNAGLYSVVVSSLYGSVTNTPEQLVVNPANLSLGLFAGVIIQGTVGYNYVIQGSTDLSSTNSWVTLTNITLTAPVQIWFDGSVDVHNAPQKYYRVLP
jgi:hypothetical protein